MLQLHLSDQHFYGQLMCILKYMFGGISIFSYKELCVVLLDQRLRAITLSSEVSETVFKVTETRSWISSDLSACFPRNMSVYACIYVHDTFCVEVMHFV